MAPKRRTIEERTSTESAVKPWREQWSVKVRAESQKDSPVRAWKEMANRVRNSR